MSIQLISVSDEKKGEMVRDSKVLREQLSYLALPDPKERTIASALLDQIDVGVSFFVTEGKTLCPSGGDAVYVRVRAYDIVFGKEWDPKNGSFFIRHQNGIIIPSLRMPIELAVKVEHRGELLGMTAQYCGEGVTNLAMRQKYSKMNTRHRDLMRAGLTIKFVRVPVIPGTYSYNRVLDVCCVDSGIKNGVVEDTVIFPIKFLEGIKSKSVSDSKGVIQLEYVPPDWFHTPKELNLRAAGMFDTLRQQPERVLRQVTA